MKNIINLTPHIIRVQTQNETIEFLPTNIPARMEVVQLDLGMINGISVRGSSYGNISDLPEPQENTIYIVSTLIAQRAKRLDLVSPDTFNGVIRDKDNRIFAVTAFQCFVENK